MTKEQKENQPVSVETPETEEEVPPEGGRNTTPKKTGRTKEIGAKDNRAFWLTCGCVAALAIFGLIDVFTERDIMEDSQMLVSFFEIMKYVITTSLGFFFATTVTKNE